MAGSVGVLGVAAKERRYRAESEKEDNRLYRPEQSIPESATIVHSDIIAES